MKIIYAADATVVHEEEGTVAHTYSFPDYQFMINEQAPKTTQSWRHHEIIMETLYLIDGELEVLWHDHNAEMSQILQPGDLVQFEHTPHTLRNNSDLPVHFVVTKRLPLAKDYSDTFKTDKVSS